MQKPSYDPGLTQRYTGSLQRVINKDGSFNVRREGATWRDFHPYLQLINMRWPKFLLMLFLAYLVINSGSKLTEVWRSLVVAVTSWRKRFA